MVCENEVSLAWNVEFAGIAHLAPSATVAKARRAYLEDLGLSVCPHTGGTTMLRALFITTRCSKVLLLWTGRGSLTMIAIVSQILGTYRGINPYLRVSLINALSVGKPKPL